MNEGALHGGGSTVPDPPPYRPVQTYNLQSPFISKIWLSSGKMCVFWGRAMQGLYILNMQGLYILNPDYPTQPRSYNRLLLVE